MRWLPPIMVFSLILLGGCASSSDHRAQDAATRQEVVTEIKRICSLPPTQRQAEIDRVKREAGMSIVCPDP